MTVREMKESDWKDVAAILQDSIDKGTVTFSTRVQPYEEWDREHLRECRFVADEGGRAVGFAVISSTSSKPAYHGFVELSIYVAPDWRRKGVGSALMETMIQESEKSGFWTLYSVICSINKPSIELHKKHGFRIIGERKDNAKDIFGVWQSCTLMERRSAKIY
jgi:Sortase and related acyltransferases